MTTYATQDDLIARFGVDELVQLTDRSMAQAIDEAAVAAALTDAQATIDAYLASRYATPVTPSPALLVRFCADIARYLLHGNAATEAVRKAHDDAVRMLRDLSTGAAVLPGAAAADPTSTPASPPGLALVNAPDRPFAPGNLRDYLG